MNVSGFTPNPYIQPGGGSKLNPSQQNTLNKVSDILKAFGIESKNISNVTVEKGASRSSILQTINQVSFLSITPSQANVLQSMGIPAHAASLAIAVHGGETVKSLKKKLTDIHEDTVDEAVFEEIAQLFNTGQKSDAYVFSDNKGGVFLIRSSLQEIASSEESEEDEKDK